MTDQCHAGTALLIREYQVEYRRASLTPVAFSTASDLPVARPDPLDRSFHIRSRIASAADNGLDQAASGLAALMSSTIHWTPV